MENANLKNIDYWEKLLSDLPESYREWFKKEEEYLQKNITRDAKVLEVGCGEGRSLKDILPITKNLIGIDNDKKAVEDAKNNFKDYPSVKILLADAIELPFENKSFDFVICMTTFANFGDKKYKALGEMGRVLKENGKIIISVFNEDALEDRLSTYKYYPGNFEVKENGTVIFDEIISEQFSKEQIKKILEENGFKISELIKEGVFYIIKAEKSQDEDR